MKASKMLIATLKEAPNEPQIASHVLLIRAGMIRKLVAGVYNYLPLGLRVLNKVENVIREEMDNSGALEILSSAIQPKELWEESGRWSKYGPELMRFNDRHEREFCLGPTHEEIFTDLVRTEIKSKKNLPICIYQIQTKYRDELRPRFGLMRGREFIMKDAYSFDLDEKGLEVSYQTMHKTYENIFNRLGLNYKIVLADTGAIGGSGSHQFMALSEVGESDIIYCDCGYAADIEKADSFVNLIPAGKDGANYVLDAKTLEKAKILTDVDKFLELCNSDYFDEDYSFISDIKNDKDDKPMMEDPSGEPEEDGEPEPDDDAESEEDERMQEDESTNKEEGQDGRNADEEEREEMGDDGNQEVSKDMEELMEEWEQLAE